MANSELKDFQTIGNAQINEITRGDTAPSSPLEGYVWSDIENGVVKVWDGTKWIEYGSPAVAIKTAWAYS